MSSTLADRERESARSSLTGGRPSLVEQNRAHPEERGNEQGVGFHLTLPLVGGDLRRAPPPGRRADELELTSSVRRIAGSAIVSPHR
jgi:hypothetical protein